MTEQERFDLMRDEIIDLKNEINRLQAENERLQEANTKLMTDFNGLSGLIHRVKSEAYKEFAERLKENSIATFSFKGVVMVEEIDNLLKELVGNNETVL